jgi:hypothetical protein
MNEDQEKVIQSFRVMFDQMYMQLVDFFNKLPIHSNAARTFAVMNLDQGAFWVREAIANIEFPELEKKEEKNDQVNH